LGRGGYTPKAIDKARDELFSHIRRCGVLEAEDEPRSEWFDDTIEYLGERYPELTPDELVDLRTIGQRYCKPAISRATKVETPPEESGDAAGGDEETSTEEEPVDAGEASAA
jgi:hypothetical protein